jgi:zinc protease
MRRRQIVLTGLAAGLVGLTARSAGAVDIKPLTTPAGIKAWLVEDKSVPVVTLSFSFAGGAATEPEAQKGVTSLMATLLTDGAGAAPAQAFKQRVEAAAMSLGFSAGLDRLNGSLRTLSANRQEGFELLRLALAQPRFDSDMVEQRRAQTIAALNQAMQRPTTVAERTLMANLFPGHPYGLNPDGTPASVKAIKVDDIRKRAADVLGRAGLIVAAVGDIDEAELARQLDRAFGELPAGGATGLPPDWSPPTKPRTVVVERQVPQSAVRMALPSIARLDPDWQAAFVMTHILGGGGQQSRLFAEVREKRGLAYGASAGLRAYRKASLLAVSTASANERVAEAVKVVRAEMARLRNDGVGEQELGDAKTYLTGSLPVSLDSSSSVAGLLHSMLVDGLPRDYLARRTSLIASVTAEDVKRMARRLLRDDILTTVVVGKPDGLSAEP